MSDGTSAGDMLQRRLGRRTAGKFGSIGLKALGGGVGAGGEKRRGLLSSLILSQH